MRKSLLVSVVVVGACSAEGPASTGDVVQELADPEPAFSIQSARFSNAVGGDPTTIEYCGSAPQAACTPAPFAQVRWGVPAYATAKSGLGFDPAGGHVVVYDEVFDLGSLTHFNFPTYSGTWASDVTLDLHLRIDPSDLTAPLFDEEIHIPFTMNETPNDPLTTCPYSPSLTPCSDKITFGTAAFNLGAATPTTIYQLEIVGFVDPTSSSPTDGLVSEEYMSTSAVLRAVLTETCVDTDADSICDEVDACIGDEIACPPDPCPCDAEWANHGEYVSCVAHHTDDLVKAGELTHQRRAEIVSSAGQSSCGK
jgi:hypothetical protein